MSAKLEITFCIGLCLFAIACTGEVESPAAAGSGGAGGVGATSGAGGASGNAGVGGAGTGAGAAGNAGAGAGASGNGADAGALDAGSDAALDASEAVPDAGPDPLAGDFEIGPNPPPHPDVSEHDVPHGKSFDFMMDSTKSAIFPGTTSTLKPENQHAFMRHVKVYIPAQYVNGDAAPFMVVADARDQGEIRNTLDNLIADDRLPTIVAIFIDSGGGDSKGSERGLEYDTMSDAYSRFIDTEVVPAVTSNAGIKAMYSSFALTDDPEGRAAYGCSSGGSASLIQGWFTPDRFRKLITYSGTFVDQQDDDAPTEQQYPLGAWEFHSGLSLIANNPKKPLRIALEVGENDNGSTQDEAGHHNWVLANQRTAAALAAKGYAYRFVYVKGAGHCDGVAIKATLPDTMEFIWRNYPR